MASSLTSASVFCTVGLSLSLSLSLFATIILWLLNIEFGYKRNDIIAKLAIKFSYLQKPLLIMTLFVAYEGSGAREALNFPIITT